MFSISLDVKNEKKGLMNFEIDVENLIHKP